MSVRQLINMAKGRWKCSRSLTTFESLIYRRKIIKPVTGENINALDERLISNQTKIEGSLQGEVRSCINLYDRSQIRYNEQHSSVGYLSCCLNCLVFKTHSCSHCSSYSGEVLRQSKSEGETGPGSPLRLDRQENLSNTKVSTFKPQQRSS